MAVVIRLVPFPKTDGIAPLGGDDRAESRHYGEVKRFDTLQVTDRDRDVIKQLHDTWRTWA